MALAALLLWPGNGQTDEILVLRGAPLKPYDEAIAGFNRVISALPQTPGVKTIAPYVIDQLDISGPEAITAPGEQITALHPELVLAVGNESLAVVKERKMPVISVLAANLGLTGGPASRIHQVPIVVPPSGQLTAIDQNLPTIRRVGILYDPQNSAALLTAFHAAAGQRHMTLIARELSDPKLVHKALTAMEGAIDALLLIPDPSVVTPLTMELFALFSLEKRIPIIAFSPKYLKLGAVMSIYTPPSAMGEAAGRLAGQLLTGVRPTTLDPIQPTVEVEINQRVAQIIGLDLTQNKN